MMTDLGSILDVPMVCTTCGSRCLVRDAEPDCDGEGALGCPEADCGGLLDEWATLEDANS